MLAYIVAGALSLACTPRASVPPTTVPVPDSTAAALFAYDAAAPLELRDSAAGVQDGVAVHAVSLASPRGGRATGLMYVPARPAGAGRLAGIVLGHGTGNGARTQGPKAIYLARRGAVVLVLDAPFVRRGGPALRFTPADSAELAQYVVDQRRAVDLLAARADVDPARIGYVGHSYGAMVGALLSGVEPRIASYALSAADVGLAGHMESGAELPPEYAALTDAARRRWKASVQMFDTRRMVGRASAAPMLFQNGRQDRTVVPSSAVALHGAARHPFTVTWYDAGHRLPARGHYDQLAWLARTLGTTPPVPADEAGPAFAPAPG